MGVDEENHDSERELEAEADAARTGRSGLPPGRTFLYTVVAQVHVAVHGELAPSDEEWQAYLDDVVSVVPRVRAMFVWSDGAGPSAKQRRMSAEHWRRFAPMPPIAVLSANPLVRVIASSLSWVLGNNLKMFSPDALDAAGDHLGLDATQREQLRATLQRLRREVSG